MDDKKISVEKAIRLLKEDGIEITKEEAQTLLDFFYFIAEILVEQYLSERNN